MDSKECEVLDELVVKLHLKEAINGFITLEVKFKLNIIEAGRFDKPVGGELHVDMSTFDGVGWVNILEFEAEAQGFHTCHHTGNISKSRILLLGYKRAVLSQDSNLQTSEHA